jgi:sulfoxide reductase heme-binding subunit YedZ
MVHRGGPPDYARASTPPRPHDRKTSSVNLLARIRRLPYTPLQIAIHLYVWGSLALIALYLFTGNLTANPLQDIQQRTGRLAITLLVLSLACTPMANITGWREPLKRSRALGLYGFMVAVIHILIFLDLDNGIAWNFFNQTVSEKPYILLGMAAFLLLIPLSITSFDIWKIRLGKRWKRLHQLVYLIVPIVVLHYALSVKGDIFRLEGNILSPLLYGLVVLLLLVLRLPFVRRFFTALRPRIRSWVSRTAPGMRSNAPARPTGHAALEARRGAGHSA